MNLENSRNFFEKEASCFRYGSVCSGIEAASVAWKVLGWIPAWFAEVEAFPSAVLAHHWPEIINLGDMTKIADAVRAGKVEAPDLLVGGTPCQAFSIAGLRHGLADERGKLTLSYVELANAIDEKRRECGKKESIIVWENVPGVLSSKDNAFGHFLAGLAGEDDQLQPAGEKWTRAGCVYGSQRTIVWRVLDAQYFGLAQRRRRLFIVASARKNLDLVKVLFESERVCIDTPPHREGDREEKRAKTVVPIAANGITGSNKQITGPLLASAGVNRFLGNQEAFSGDYYVLQNIKKDMSDVKIRLLTPIECERLQGFPDNHTQISWRGKDVSECPDGPRYKAIGNSMAVPVMQWIGERIQKAVSSVDELVVHSFYCQSLNELRSRKEHILKEIGDQWCTPDALWWGINARFGPFVLDLFADHHNAKCEAYYTAEDNALVQDWSVRLQELGGAAYANPPYSRTQKHDGQYITGMSHIIQHTMTMREKGGRYVFLIKAATSESWWPENADHIAFIRGRIGFDVPDWFIPADEKQKPSDAFFAGAIAVFDKNWVGPSIGYISREELETMGQMFIRQIERGARRTNDAA